MHIVECCRAGGVFFGGDARQPSTAELDAPRVDGAPWIVVGETCGGGMWTSRKIGRKRVALLRFFARVGIVQTCSEGAIAQVPTALCGALDRKNVQLRQIDVVDEGQSRAHFTFHARGSRGDALAHEVIAQCDGTKIALLLPICRDVEDCHCVRDGGFHCHAARKVH